MSDVTARLEYLRGEIRAERISMSEVIELQNLADQIEPGDVELLQWAGVPEFPEWHCTRCGRELNAEGADEDGATNCQMSDPVTGDVDWTTPHTLTP
jgi:hypothetical protein